MLLCNEVDFLLRNKNMQKSFFVGALIGLIVGFIIGWAMVKSQVPLKVANSPTSSAASGTTISAKELDLRMGMRKLWEDHITWTRMYIVSVAFNNPDSSNIAARLLQNQADIGNAIKPYYGDDAGNKLTNLLKEHINGAVALVSAAKAGNQTALAAANDRWYKNANDIADFLSQANPNWPNDQMKAMMKDHLDLTKQEAVDALDKKYDASIADYDKVHGQILTMADMLSSGIVKQFPNQF